MRIVHVCPRSYPYIGGVQVVVRNIVKYAQRIGHEVKVYATDPSIASPQTRIIDEIEERIYPVFAPNDAYYLPHPAMLLELSKENADILHSHDLHSFTTLSAYLAHKINPRACFVVSTYYHGKGHSKPAEILGHFYRPVLREVLKDVDGIIVNSNTQRTIIDKTFEPSSRVFTVYDGVNLDGIRTARAFDSSADSKILLYVGRLEKYKNIHIAVEALRNLPENYHFYVIGSGPFKSNLMKYAESLGLANRVHFLGFQPDEIVYQWLKAAHVFVHLSNAESFGMTCIESLAAGTPVVANSDGLGLSETAMLYPKSILSYRVDKEPISRLSKLIMDTAKSKPINEDVSRFSWDKIGEKVVAVYERILDRRINQTAKGNT